MHKGDKVFILPGRKTYHYKDDDCPVTSSILKGKKLAEVITENEAKSQGLNLCIHCKKEYEQDQIERPFKWIKKVYKMFT